MIPGAAVTQPSQPAITNLVHYRDAGNGSCRAAMVVGLPDVDGLAVDLYVITPSGSFFRQAILDTDGTADRSWHWPDHT
jgi:uncharacterized protein YfaP (DUF2135 family)